MVMLKLTSRLALAFASVCSLNATLMLTLVLINGGHADVGVGARCVVGADLEVDVEVGVVVGGEAF